MILSITMMLILKITMQFWETTSECRKSSGYEIRVFFGQIKSRCQY